MARNIIFIILFIVLYGGLFLLGSVKTEEMTDRNGFGEFTESGYSCDAYSFEMEFEPDWIPMDGVAIEKCYTESELQEYFGEPGSYDLVAGFTSPELYVECVRYKNVGLGSEYFTSSYLERELDYYKQNISLVGGNLSGSGSYVLHAQGNGADMGVYYYDYTLDGEFYSEINCFVNCGKDTIWFYGYYKNQEGLSKMLNFLNTGFVMNSASTTTV